VAIVVPAAANAVPAANAAPAVLVANEIHPARGRVEAVQALPGRAHHVPRRRLGRPLRALQLRGQQPVLLKPHAKSRQRLRRRSPKRLPD
jgi:hypothetical protein